MPDPEVVSMKLTPDSVRPDRDLSTPGFRRASRHKPELRVRSVWRTLSHACHYHPGEVQMKFARPDVFHPKIVLAVAARWSRVGDDAN